MFIYCGEKQASRHIFSPLNHLPCYVAWFSPQVTFLLTEDPNYTSESRGRKRKRRRRRRELLSPDRFSLYSSLSSLSGGLTIFTTNSDIRSVSAIVEDNTAVDKVRQELPPMNQIRCVPKTKKETQWIRFFSRGLPANRQCLQVLVNACSRMSIVRRASYIVRLLAFRSLKKVDESKEREREIKIKQ